MFPVRTTAPRRRTPVVVLSLIGANAAVFFWQLALPPDLAFLSAVEWGLVPLRYTDPDWAASVGLDPGNRIPFVTSAFLHGGWLHILVNMWTLWLFGGAVEDRMGRLRFTAFYLAGGIAAAAAHIWVNPDSPVPVVGASGAIAAVLGAHVVLFPGSRVLLLIPILFIPLFVPVGALVYAGIWFAIQVAQGAGALLSPELPGGVAWWAHIGGFVGGLATARLVAPPPPPSGTGIRLPPSGPGSGPGPGPQTGPWGRR
ncbi:MAG TPA: rhomboid family intramembrane serine protease [Azospirillaceae bacterium]|nr:rhomboid family intramembrane serine protease [Azospirillaceae bacterium]